MILTLYYLKTVHSILSLMGMVDGQHDILGEPTHGQED